MSSLLSCCGSSSAKRHAAEADARHARIVSISQRSRNGSTSSFPLHDRLSAPPSYSEASRDPRLTYIVSDEKHPEVYEVSMQQAEHPPAQHQRSASPAHSNSDQSSVISIPSTRLSGLTSTYTGATNRTILVRDGGTGQRDSGSWRYSMNGSLEENSPPPSYYAESEDGDVRNNEPALHPVMTDGWLERLRSEAEAQLRNGRHGERAG